jgi:hypothetical protein
VPLVDCELAPGIARLCFDCRITAEGSVKAYDLLGALNGRFGLAMNVFAVRVARTGLYKKDRKPLIGEN